MHQEGVGGRQAAHQCEARPRSGWPISGRPPHASALVQSKYACASSYARPLVKNHTSSSSPSRSVTFLSTGHGARPCEWQPRRRPAAVCDWGGGAGRRTDELLALARRVARRTEHDVREAERVEQLVDDEGAVLGDQLLRRARHARRVLDPGEDEPRGAARAVVRARAAGARDAGECGRLGDREDRVRLHAVDAVCLFVGREAVKHRAVPRTRLLGRVALGGERRSVPSGRALEDQRPVLGHHLSRHAAQMRSGGCMRRCC